MNVPKLTKKSKVVVLTGAGISAESGIQTFRDANGLWEGHAIEEVASPEGFYKDPEMVHRFYNKRRMQLKEVEPNKAHIALARLEDEVDSFTLITQNVDDLHERGGSKNVLHMHGELRKIRNLKTHKSTHFEEEVLAEDFTEVRPDIVWFGESIMYAEQIEQALNQCDFFLCIGTSNNVYPAAGFVHAVKQNQGTVIELNLEPTNLSHYYDISIQGPATEIVPNFVNQILIKP